MRERLRPPWWGFAVAAILPLMVGIAYGSVLGLVIGVISFLIGLTLVWIALWVTSPVVYVTAQGDLGVGDALLPHWAIGTVSICDTATAQQHVRDHPATFVALRPSASPQCLLVTVADDDDPHRFWLVTAPRAEAMALALAPE